MRKHAVRDLHGASAMLDLEEITIELEERREALPIEIALHLTACALRAAVRANAELGPLDRIQLRDLVVDPRGRVLVRLRGGMCSEDELIRSIGLLLFSLLAGERPNGRVGIPLGLLAQENVPEDVVHLVARATAVLWERRYTRLAPFLADLEERSAAQPRRVTPGILLEVLRRNGLLDRPRPLQVRRTSDAGHWFSAA